MKLDLDMMLDLDLIIYSEHSTTHTHSPHKVVKKKSIFYNFLEVDI